MSSVNQKRIKQIRPRQSGSFPTSIPIGTDGLLVDMISQLDLEEEIRLGGNHYVDIYDTKTDTVIKEWYLSESKGTTPIEQVNDNIVKYTVYTTIASKVQTRIGTKNPNEEENDFITWKDGQNYDPSDSTTFGDFLVTREQLDPKITRIDITLYKGNFQIELHHKVIYLYESIDGRIAVDEQVDDIDSVNPFDDEEDEPEPTPEPSPQPEPDNGGNGNNIEEPEVEG